MYASGMTFLRHLIVFCFCSSHKRNIVLTPWRPLKMAPGASISPCHPVATPLADSALKIEAARSVTYFLTCRRKKTHRGLRKSACHVTLTQRHCPKSTDTGGSRGSNHFQNVEQSTFRLPYAFSTTGVLPRLGGLG
ncbi:hypothetical protein AVEN_202577-1, partial [Araneus ventricosus]